MRSGMEAKPMPRIFSLPNDVLLHIFESIRTLRGLIRLSQTCRWFRNAIMPVLFRCIRVRPQWLAKVTFVPQTLWPHIQVIDLYGAFNDLQAKEQRAAALLSNALSHMPNLHTVVLTSSHPRADCIPWPILTAIISTPHLSQLHVQGSFCEAHYSPDSFSVPTFVAPLTSLHVRPKDYRKYPRNSAADNNALALLVDHVNGSLESAVLPLESASLSVLSRKQWPRLRELALRGERCVEADPPHTIMDTLQQMPRLRVLKLELTQLEGLDPQIIWPRGYSGAFPCPDLETFEVSYPHPQDKVYDHLPHTLRCFALRCWPRHYVHLLWPDVDTMRDLEWHSPILSASEMLRILRRCHASGTLSDVESLDIEFQGEGGDLALFQFLPVVFPKLIFLQIHRYREAGATEIPVAEIASALSPLSRLRALGVHLDFPNAPHPFISRTYHRDTGVADFKRFVDQLAQVFAKTLGPSVEYVCFLRRRECSNTWDLYEICRAGNRSAYTEPRAGTLKLLYGYPMEDEAGPPVLMRHPRYLNLERRDIA